MKDFKLMIGGAVKHYKNILLNRNICNDITVYDGLNNCSWNGGRYNRDIKLTDKMIQTYYNLNIKIALTFSNPIINLNDKIGNQLLKKFHKEGNCIILVNDKLRAYIRKNFPKYKLIYSVTGHDTSALLKDKYYNVYLQLEKKYDYIVPKMEHIFQDKFLLLDQSKYEIMLNDTCVYDCPYYKEHFEEIAKINSENKKLSIEEKTKIEECWIDKFDPNISSCVRGMDITLKDFKILYNRGIRNFKITGRENSTKDMLDEILKYKGNI